MTPRPKLFRAAFFAAVLAFASVLTAAPADAGLRDTLENVRDAVGCTAKAVFNLMNVFEPGMRNFERMTGEEYDRKANRSVKEALEECTAAAENIVARGLGVEKIAGKARDLAGKVGGAAETVKDAVGKVSEWFGKEGKEGKEKVAPDDRRMALSVSGPERRFYEEETGVLGGDPLPEPARAAEHTAVKRPVGEEQSPTAAAPGARDGEVWRDPWGGEESVEAEAETQPLAVGDDGAPSWTRTDRTEPSAGAGPSASAGTGNAWDDEAQDDPWGSGEDAADTWETVAANEADPWSQTAYLEPEPWEQGETAPDYDAGETVHDEEPGYADVIGSESGYENALDTLERREAEARRAAEAERVRAEREAELAQQQAESEAEKASVSDSHSGSGNSSSQDAFSQSTVRSSNCQEDLTPTCRQAIATIEARDEAIGARSNSSLSIPEVLELAAEHYKFILDHFPVCITTETRPHCKAEGERFLAEIRRSYEETLDSAHQWRGE